MGEGFAMQLDQMLSYPGSHQTMESFRESSATLLFCFKPLSLLDAACVWHMCVYAQISVFRARTHATAK